jgi:hypothetical protein
MLMLGEGGDPGGEMGDIGATKVEQMGEDGEEVGMLEIQAREESITRGREDV